MIFQEPMPIEHYTIFPEGSVNAHLTYTIFQECHVYFLLENIFLGTSYFLI